GRLSSGPVPLVLAGTVGKGRVVVINAAGVYRWGLTASGIAGRAGVETAFFGGICRWLAGGSEDHPVRIEAPEITPEGRPVPIRITATPAGVPGAEARVTARAVGGKSPAGSQVEAKLTPAGGGEFSGSVALGAGTYLLRGNVTRGGRSIGSDSIRVAVGVQGIEFETLAADPSSLRRLAESSGGMAAPVDSAGPVIERLRSPDLSRVRLAEVDLFHNPLLFTILIAALALEWAMRRRFHLM